jgi:ATP-dependent 26S proteasome regulatory subunit
LDSLVDFPEPEAEYRRRLWERSLGTTMPRAADLDLAFLAESFKLSGGAIRNIAVAAAYAAAEANRPLDMGDLVRATQREYMKLGRMVVESEFGPYYQFLG